MKLIKALNNNVALVESSKGEYIVMGKGVAFGKSTSDELDTNLVEKKYVLQDDKVKDLDSLMLRVGADDLELASKIISEGEKTLGYTCSSSILMALADHLNLALERAGENLFFGTPLEWDIKLIYPNEYRLALRAVDMINDLKGVNLPKQEASFIALHFINANTTEANMHETVFTTKVIQNILNIVRRYYGKDISEDNFEVSRFITHIRYFVKRQVSGDGVNTDVDIATAVFEKCPKDYKCALRIIEFLKKEYDWDVNTSEALYLTLHLNRINQS